MRIQVDDDPMLFQIPWEALYDRQQAWLATNASTPVLRVLNSNMIVAARPPVTPPLKLMIAVANPEGDLDVAGELTDIDARIRAVQGDASPSLVVLEPLRRATFGSLINAVGNHRPHILHYIGHGGFEDGAGFLHLHDEVDSRRARRIAADRFAEMLANDPPRLVVLNTCQGATASTYNPFGGIAQSLIRIGVPNVVAMQYPISDRAAIVFSSALYTALSHGDPVDISVNRARHAIKLCDPVEHELITPVLYAAQNACGDMLVVADASDDLRPAPARRLPPPAAMRPGASPDLGLGGRSVLGHLEWSAAVLAPHSTPASAKPGPLRTSPPLTRLAR